MIGSIVGLSRWLSEKASLLVAKLFSRNKIRHGLSTSSPEQTLADAIRNRGYDSFTAYANSAPRASLKELAGQLGGQEWTLHTRLLIEAERAGNVERYARSLFIRYLHDETSSENYFGTLGPAWAVDFALYRTALSLTRNYRMPCMRVALGYMRADIGFNWKPQHADDRALRELFGTYWPESSIAFFAPVLRTYARHHARLPRLVMDGEEQSADRDTPTRPARDDDEGDGYPPPPWAA